MISIPTSWNRYEADGVTTRACTATSTDGGNFCFFAFDGNDDTEWAADQNMQGTSITVKLGLDGETAKYRVVKTKFKYRDAMSDRSGSVTVTGNSVSGSQEISSGVAQERLMTWGPHSDIIGNTLTLTATGGNPWMDGEGFGIKEVSFWGCPV
jgi:hypothetical protein